MGLGGGRTSQTYYWVGLSFTLEIIKIKTSGTKFQDFYIFDPTKNITDRPKNVDNTGSIILIPVWTKIPGRLMRNSNLWKKFRLMDLSGHY